MTRLSLIVVALAACGAEPTAPPPTVAADPSSIEATPTGPADLVVARVDGRPIHASCVTAQAARGIDRRAALDECIDFELLAGAAAERGLASSPAVQAARREAMVSRFIDAEFTAKVRTEADLPVNLVANAVDRHGPLTRPVQRTGVYARAALPEGTVDGSPEERAANEVIEQLHRSLASRRDLFPDDLSEAARQMGAAHGITLEYEQRPYPTAIDGATDPAWRKALFDIPAIGMISPPIRTRFGWEVVLWVDTVPGVERTRDELVATLFPELRRQYFRGWTNRFAKLAKIEVHNEQLQRWVQGAR